jgi:peroxiredoxin
MLAVGDPIPGGTLREFIEVEGNGCSLGPNAFDVAEISRGKTIAVFGLPGAFTPTCSAKHVPGYVAEAAALRAAGVDEVWCVSVNDPFVMGAWGREQKTAGAVRMMADGAAEWTGPSRPDHGPHGARHGHPLAALLDARPRRRRRTLNVEAPGQFAVSDAATLRKQAEALRATP